MSIRHCGHAEDKTYFREYYKRFLEPPEPTKEEIRTAKLWKCSDCLRWVSLIGAHRRPPLVIGD